MRDFFLESTFGTLIFALVNNTSWNMNVKSFLTKSRKREKEPISSGKTKTQRFCNAFLLQVIRDFPIFAPNE